ncbi:MAG: putative sulfate/molybdate transporter [Candidatus Thorarchaeota archaeon]
MAQEPDRSFRFDRMELGGSLGDLGTLLPLAVGMIVLNQMHATNVLVAVGLFYILAGLYFRIPVAVQPMKVIGAYAIAAGMTPQQIVSSSLWMGALVLFLGVTGLIGVIRRYTPRSTVPGIQLAVGVVLLIQGLKLIVDQDPSLAVQRIGPVNTGLLLGMGGLVLTLFLLESRKLPAALALIAFGIAVGLIIGNPLDHGTFSWGFHVPGPVPYGWPGWDEFVWVVPVVVLPQLPMTIGNAIISNTDLAHEYFREKAHRVTNRSVSISQGLANLASFFLGGIPMCHGAGGLAAHYKFGARTGGSNLYIGGIFLVLALIFGERIVSVLRLIPLSILGVLLTFAGLQLALMIQDLRDRKDLFVALFMLGLALAFNLAVAFVAGIAVAYAVKTPRISV